ncbi:MAG: DUF5686 family protein [Bacteroidetes bacterium]|nr:DUF5686 family protein [Bacteroidota bacterium]MDA1119366.1 DUF5686 family protein [Bacteroidota bacterium]
MKFGFVTLVVIFLPFLSQASKLHGRVVDTDSMGLPFATLYIEGTTNGTTTNSQGYYSMELASRDYTIVFQYVGYKSIREKVSIGENDLILNVTLEFEVVELDEIIVTAGENPADRIVRETINKRKFYLEQVDSYSCDVYIKGLQTLDKRPDKIFGIPVTIDTGIVYLSESVSKFSFQKPDKIKETMISSKVSGYNNAFSFNQASEMMVNIYDNLQQYEGLTQRGIVSPIANNAFMFYDYELEGTKMEGSYLINKIKVIPKRPNDPVISGFIYIMEDSWRIHSIDILLTKANQIEFVDSLRIQQVFAPVTDDVWMLLSQKFIFELKVFGFEGKGNFVGVYSNYEVEPVREKKYFTNEILAINEEANTRDSIYWKAIRPIPLTTLERRDYTVKDSLQVIRESKDYKDSVDRKGNKLSVGNLLVSGYTHRSSFQKKSFRIDPITQALQYNTVEGLVLNFDAGFRKDLSRERRYEIKPAIRYGFGNDRFNTKLNLEYQYNRKRFSSIETTFGRFVEQLNPGAISPLINTFETLIIGKNYMKLYARDFWEGRYRSELENGIMMTAKVEYSQRTDLVNTDDYSFRKKEKRDFTNNNPLNLAVTDTSFPKHQALKTSLGFRFIFNQKYISRPDRKIIYGSKLPILNVEFIKGYDLFGSDVSFNELRFWANDKWDLGLVGKSEIQAEAGFFFGNDEMAFPDFEHFDGNRTEFAQFDINNFQLLDYYLYSTNDKYFTGHFEHHFNGFVFNKIPLIRKLKMQSVASMHYLKIPGIAGYMELGFGLEHIFKVVRVDFVTSILDVKRSGVRIGIGF